MRCAVVVVVLVDVDAAAAAGLEHAPDEAGELADVVQGDAVGRGVPCLPGWSRRVVGFDFVAVHGAIETLQTSKGARECTPIFS